MLELSITDQPQLRVAAFATEFTPTLAALPTPHWLIKLLRKDAGAPVQRSEELRGAVRELLRRGGYKPTGRGKPASEYLVRAAEEGVLGAINLAVDACNVVSLHSGLPISVIDVQRAQPPLRIATAVSEEKYVFNAAGQEIDLSGLICLYDTAGPCANAVKDSQRTKTHGGTRQTLSVIWGVVGFEGQLAVADRWYRDLLERAGAATESAVVRT